MVPATDIISDLKKINNPLSQKSSTVISLKRNKNGGFVSNSMISNPNN